MNLETANQIKAEIDKALPKKIKAVIGHQTNGSKHIYLFRDTGRNYFKFGSIEPCNQTEFAICARCDGMYVPFDTASDIDGIVKLALDLVNKFVAETPQYQLAGAKQADYSGDEHYNLLAFNQNHREMIEKLVDFALKELKLAKKDVFIKFTKSTNGSGHCTFPRMATGENSYFDQWTKLHLIKIPDPMKAPEMGDWLLVLFHELVHMEQMKTGKLTMTHFNGRPTKDLSIGNDDYNHQPEELDANRRGMKLVLKAAKKFGLKVQQNDLNQIVKQTHIKDVQPLVDKFFEGNLTSTAECDTLPSTSTDTTGKEPTMSDQTATTITVKDAILALIAKHGPLPTKQIKELLVSDYPDLDLATKNKPMGKVGNELAHHKTHKRLVQDAEKRYCLPDGEAPVTKEEPSGETKKAPTPQEVKDKVMPKADADADTPKDDEPKAEVDQSYVDLYRVAKVIETIIVDDVVQLHADGAEKIKVYINTDHKFCLSYHKDGELADSIDLIAVPATMNSANATRMQDAFNDIMDKIIAGDDSIVALYHNDPDFAEAIKIVDGEADAKSATEVKEAPKEPDADEKVEEPQATETETPAPEKVTAANITDDDLKDLWYEFPDCFVDAITQALEMRERAKGKADRQARIAELEAELAELKAQD